ncbi:MAG: BspA family leucine-rich repeat surface protein [Ruminococcaceae bacterium]|nr:BspA family leucine-rich repeat surface protein [Oscillospiraceae bacterium]
MKIKTSLWISRIVAVILFAVSINTGLVVAKAEEDSFIPVLKDSGAWYKQSRLKSIRTSSATETEGNIEENLLYPMLAMDDTWYKGNTARASITKITIADSYTVTGNEKESWDASSLQDGSVMCYINGTELTIAGNGSGKIHLNYDSFCTFSDSSDKGDYFSSLIEIANADLLDTSKVNTMRGMFLNACSLETVDVSNWDTSNATDMSYMFASIISNKEMSFTSLDVSKWDTSNVINMNRMFQLCVSLESLDVDEWDTGKVESFSGMFQRCKSLSTLDVSSWDTKNVTDMSFMFHCENMPLGSIDVSGWDVSNVRTFDHFVAHAKLKLTGVENWKNSVVVVMNAMFHMCQNKTLDVSGFETSNVITFDQMFEGCNQLTEIIGLENFETSKSVGFSQMFSSCSRLKTLNLESFDTRNAKNDVQISSNGATSKTLYNMFAGTIRLKEIKIGENFSFNGDGTNTIEENKALFRTQSSSYITGADGKWYNEKGIAFEPASIPDKTAGTYSAVPYLSVTNAKMENSNIEVSVLVEEKLIAKGGTVIIALYNESGMAGFFPITAQKQVDHTFENLPEGNYTVKVFCWQDLKTIVPLYCAITKKVE